MSSEEARAAAYRQSQRNRLAFIQTMRARLRAPLANRRAVEADWQPLLDWTREHRADVGQTDPAGGPERNLRRGVELP